MKIKIISLVLILTVSICSLSSCILLDTDGILGSFMEDKPSNSDNNTTINVNGGPNYENINITSSENKTFLQPARRCCRQ